MKVTPIHKNTVLVFGVFDGLHEGHQFFLSNALQYGDSLVVVVARDSDVLSRKKRTPRWNEQERIKKIQSHFKEAFVVLGDQQENTWQSIYTYQPQVIALGYDQHVLKQALKHSLHSFTPVPKIVVLPEHQSETYNSTRLHHS